jgi:hypothetical protein
MTAASDELGCKGLMNAGFGARFFPEDLLAFLLAFLRAAGRLAAFLADFLPAVFLLVVAIATPPELSENSCVPRNQRNYRLKQYTDRAQLQ